MHRAGGVLIRHPLIPIGIRVVPWLAPGVLKACFFYVLVLHATLDSTCIIVLHCIARYYPYHARCTVHAALYSTVMLAIHTSIMPLVYVQVCRAWWRGDSSPSTKLHLLYVLLSGLIYAGGGGGGGGVNGAGIVVGHPTPIVTKG